MGMIFVIFFFIIMTGLTIGGLLAVQREKIKLLQIIFFVIFFLILCYIGMIVGMFLSGWISVKLLEYVLTVTALLFIVACVTRFHPTFGFFHPGDRILLIMLIWLFVLMGLEWGLLGLRTFFTFTSSILFAASLFIGLIVQLQIKQKLWRFSLIPYTPLTWILLASLFKLF